MARTSEQVVYALDLLFNPNADGSNLEEIPERVYSSVAQALKSLEVVLDCYSACIPTPGSQIEAAKALIGWTREAAAERYEAKVWP